jgi:predicted enzyme related to lactoylglutathione lyase
MPAPSTRSGAPCWMDLFTTDLPACERFYTELFGWTAEHSDDERYGGYVMLNKDDKPVAGAMRNDNDQQAPNMWTVYLRTDDVGATVARAKEAGGAVFVDTMTVPDVGTMAVIGDAGGAGVGLWKAGPFEGSAVVGEDGFPAWFELHTRAYDETLAFYRDVLGWETHTMSDDPTFRYTVLGTEQDQAAGVMDMTTGGVAADAPGGWFVYVQVADADASAAKAEELGGTVVDAPEDTPYGRLATLADPSGARIKILQPPR